MDIRPTLLAALPLILVLTGLAAAIALFPQSMDIRNKAAEPTPTITTVPLPTATADTPAPNNNQATSPVTICSSLYNPVCGLDNLSYDNSCEASLAQIPIAYSGPCQLPVTTNPEN